MKYYSHLYINIRTSKNFESLQNYKYKINNLLREYGNFLTRNYFFFCIFLRYILRNTFLDISKIHYLNRLQLITTGNTKQKKNSNETYALQNTRTRFWSAAGFLGERNTVYFINRPILSILTEFRRKLTVFQHTSTVVIITSRYL